MVLTTSPTTLSGPFNMKGRGYQTRGMYESTPSHWHIPMYRNQDDASLGIYDIEAPNRSRAFEIARKACWDEFTLGY